MRGASAHTGRRGGGGGARRDTPGAEGLGATHLPRRCVASLRRACMCGIRSSLLRALRSAFSGSCGTQHANALQPPRKKPDTSSPSVLVLSLSSSCAVPWPRSCAMRGEGVPGAQVSLAAESNKRPGRRRPATRASQSRQPAGGRKGTGLGRRRRRRRRRRVRGRRQDGGRQVRVSEARHTFVTLPRCRGGSTRRRAGRRAG